MSKILGKYLFLISILLLTGSTNLFAKSNTFHSTSNSEHELQLEANTHSVSNKTHSNTYLYTNTSYNAHLWFTDFLLVEDTENEGYSSKTYHPVSKTNLNYFFENRLTLGEFKELHYNISKYHTNLYKSSTRLHIKLQVFII